MRLLENQIYLSILQNRGQVSAATQILKDYKTLGHEKGNKLKKNISELSVNLDVHPFNKITTLFKKYFLKKQSKN